MMAGLSGFFKLILIILFYDMSLAQWSAVGKSQSFICVTPQSNFQSVSWLNDQKILQYFCDDTSSCYSSSTQATSLYDATITLNSSTFTSVFTIKSVTTSQHNTSWFCQTTLNTRIGDIKQYNLYVFAAVETPLCDNVTLLNNDRNIALKCWTDKVFPDATCTFYIVTNGSVVFQMSNLFITYKNDKSNTTGYYRTECNNTVSVSIVGRGSHQFYVMMYPNIPINITEDMKSKSRSTPSILIDYPRAALRTDCQFIEYIRENETQNCTCYNNNTSFLPTQVRWSKDGNEDGILNFITKRPSFQFYCTVSNILNWTDVVRYEGKVAFPPSIENLTLFDYELAPCENKSYNISGICSVGDSDPKPIVTINVNNSLFTGPIASNTREYFFEIDTNSPGIFSVSCQVQNEFFPMINLTRYTTIYESPESPKISSISNNIKHTPFANVMSVYEGLTTIICERKGGKTMYKNISLICGNVLRFSKGEDYIFIILNISRGSGKMNCTCTDWSETSCLNNKASVILSIEENQSYADDEERDIAIGLGVTAGILLLLLMIVSTMFIASRNKKKHGGQSSTLKISAHEYSDIREIATPVQDRSACYEMPIFKRNDSLQATTQTKEDSTNESQNKIEGSDSNYLGGFIVTDGINDKKELGNIEQHTEITYKRDKQLYENVVENKKMFHANDAHSSYVNE